MPSVTVSVPDEVVAVLRPVYERRGQTLAQYVEELVRQDDSNVDALPPMTPAERAAKLDEMKQRLARTPEQAEAARLALMAKARSARPLPLGKTLVEVVQALWPGDETDEEVRQTLDEIS
jgi:hypothetical protein